MVPGSALTHPSFGTISHLLNTYRYTLVVDSNKRYECSLTTVNGVECVSVKGATLITKTTDGSGEYHIIIPSWNEGMKMDLISLITNGAFPVKEDGLKVYLSHPYVPAIGLIRIHRQPGVDGWDHGKNILERYLTDDV